MICSVRGRCTIDKTRLSLRDLIFTCFLLSLHRLTEATWKEQGCPWCTNLLRKEYEYLYTKWSFLSFFVWSQSMGRVLQWGRDGSCFSHRELIKSLLCDSGNSTCVFGYWILSSIFRMHRDTPLRMKTKFVLSTFHFYLHHIHSLSHLIYIIWESTLCWGLSQELG